MARSNTSGLNRAEGRKFGLTIGAAFLALAAFTWWRGHVEVAWVAASVGLSLVLAGLVLPTRLDPIYRRWMQLAEFISRFTTPVFLGAVYLLVITPSALLLRAFGHRAIDRDPDADSYWIPREGGEWSDLDRQF